MTNDPLATLSITEADADEAAYQAERAKRNAPTVERGSATIGTMQILPTGFDKKDQVHIPFEHVVVAPEGAPRGPLEGDSFVWRVNSPAKLTDNSALGYFVRSARAIDPSIDSPRQMEGKQITFEMVTIDNGVDRNNQPLNPTVSYKVTAIGGSSAASNGGSLLTTQEELDAALATIVGFNHEAAMALLGEKGSSLISKLVLTKAIKQNPETKVYEAV